MTKSKNVLIVMNKFQVHIMNMKKSTTSGTSYLKKKVTSSVICKACFFS